MTELITLDCYKESKDITSTTRDGKIQNLIDQVSVLVEHYCDRKFIDFSDAGSPKIEWHDAKVNRVDLIEFPVIKVNFVRTSQDGGLTQVTLVENDSGKDGYFVDLDKGFIYTQISTERFLISYDVAFRSLEVTYQAGYTVDDLPEDLKLCVIDIVKYYLDTESTPTKALLGGTIENPQPYVANSFPPHIRRILDLYRFSP